LNGSRELSHERKAMMETPVLEIFSDYI
jgi:hypothetical protein